METKRHPKIWRKGKGDQPKNPRAKDKGMYYNSGCILKGNSMLGTVSGINEAMVGFLSRKIPSKSPFNFKAQAEVHPRFFLPIFSVNLFDIS